MFSEQQQLAFTDYLFIAWKRRWLVLCALVVVFVSTVIVLAAHKPLFTASARVLLERPQQVLGGQVMFAYYDPGYFETQLQLLQTEDFILKVVDELNTRSAAAAGKDGGKDAEARGGQPFHDILSGVRTVVGFFSEKLSWFGASSSTEPTALPDRPAAPGDPQYSLGTVSGSCRVRLVKNTDILEISAIYPDARKAALIANATAEVFLKDRLNRRLDSVQQVLVWLQKELKDEQVELDKSRIELYEYMNRHGILNLDEKRSTRVDEELKLLDEKVRAANENAGSLGIKYHQVVDLSRSANLVDTIPEAIGNKVLNELRTQEIQLEQEIIKLSAVYGSNHPKIMSSERQLRNIRDAKQQEIKKIINALKVQYETALLQEKSIVQARDRLQTELDALKKQTVRYFTLKREVDSNEKIYDLVLNRMKETSLTEEFTKTPSASIIQRAVVPISPTSPNVPRGLGLGLVLGLALGLGLAYLLEFLDNTFTKPDQIEQNLGLTFLGAVPRLPADTRAKPEGETAVLALTDFQSSGVEAYRALRTSILLSSADVQPQVLLVTSPGQGEGKSITAANLAAVMAHAGSRVLLLDCDLRKPKVHKMFGLDRELGLSSLLVSKEMKPEAFIQKTAEPKLDVLACGPIPPNPSELLGSKRMLALLELLRQDYERIILDSPPLLAATDAAVLTPIIDGTVLVLRAGETTRQMAHRAIKLLTDLNARITGIVLNDMMLSKNGYYYYNYYHYGQYYGEEADDGGKSKRKKRKRVKSGDIDGPVGEA
jgi:polysaccharide biosynthesis transport protein